MIETTGKETIQWPFNIHNVPGDSYQGLLGSMLLNNGIIPDVVRYIKPDDFHNSKFRLVYETMIERWKDRVEFEKCTILEYMKRKGLYANLKEDPSDSDTKAEHFVGELIENMATWRDYKRFIVEIIVDSKYRKIAMLGAKILSDVDRQIKYEDIYTEASERLIALRSEPNKGGSSISELMPGLWQDIDDYKEDRIGVKTGYPEIDNHISGLMPGNLCLLAARPQMGKTAIALNIADYVSSQNKVVAFFSVEMSEREINERLICSRARVDSHLLRRGKLTDEDLKRLTATEGLIHKNPLIIFSKQRDLESIKAEVQILKSAERLDLIIIDYIQLLNAPKAETRNQEVGLISKGLKQLAEDYDVPVLALSQLSRACDIRSGDSRPKLSDLRDSGNLEQDADIAMFIWRPVIYINDEKDKEGDWYNTQIPKRNYAEILIRKTRMGGKEGTVQLLFFPEYTRFENIEKHREQKLPEE